MKRVLFLIAAVVSFAACSKEISPITNNQQNNEIAAPGTEMTLFASIPAMEDATKAIADGSFSWSENDQIAIPISGGYAIFQYKTAKSAFTYTLTGSETFVDGTAYYPASSRPEGGYTTDFADVDAARAGFKMTAPYTVGASSITFTHASSLIDLNFSNVPSFATSVRVKEGDVVVATVALSSPTSALEVKVPVTPNGSKKYHFALMEGSNVLKEVSKTANLEAGTYYTTPGIAVNKYIVFQNSNNATHKLGIQGRTLAEEWNSDWAVKDLKSNGVVKYYIMEDQYNSADALQITLRQNDGGEDYNKSEASFVVNDRNFIFDISDNSLKTEYRIYPTSSSHASLNLYLTKPLSLYIKNTANWVNVNVYLWGYKGATKVEPWGDYKSRKTFWISPSGSEEIGTYSSLAKYDLNYELLGSDAGTSGLIIGNLDTSDKSGDLNTPFNGDIVVDFNVASSSIVATYYSNRVSAEWPGTAYTGISSSVNSSKYFSLAGSTYYGQALWGVYSVAGASQSASWSMVINRDYVVNY